MSETESDFETPPATDIGREICTQGISKILHAKKLSGELETILSYIKTDLWAVFRHAIVFEAKTNNFQQAQVLKNRASDSELCITNAQRYLYDANRSLTKALSILNGIDPDSVNTKSHGIAYEKWLRNQELAHELRVQSYGKDQEAQARDIEQCDPLPQPESYAGRVFSITAENNEPRLRDFKINKES